jgi:hypothetical protein
MPSPQTAGIVVVVDDVVGVLRRAYNRPSGVRKDDLEVHARWRSN